MRRLFFGTRRAGGGALLLTLLFPGWHQPLRGQEVRFQEHVIEPKIPGGYALLITDLNHDNRPDVIGVSQQVDSLSWYENPGWNRHILTKAKSIVNIAAADVDGDGTLEVAVESGFSMVAAESQGAISLLHDQGGLEHISDLWKVIPVDQIPTAHHVAFADVDGDGRRELIIAPLIGPGSLAPKYEGNVTLFWYRVPRDLGGPWPRMVVNGNLHGVLHRVRVVQWRPGKRQQLLTAGFDGIVLHEMTGRADKPGWKSTLLSPGHQEEAPRAGASDVQVGHLRSGRRIMAAVEPWHGNEVVVYTEEGRANWRRHVIYDKLVEGHEVCVGDFNQDGRDEIVAGDRARGKIGSSHIFYATDESGDHWEHRIFDDHMSASGCGVADINLDGRPDIVMIGSATGNIKWYENLGPAKEK